MSDRKRTVSAAVRHVLVFGTGFAALGTAQAQQQAEAPSTGTIEEVVVTGSVIKRADFDTPSPLQVISAQDLTETGRTSVSEVLRNLSANGQGTLSQSFALAFAGGGSGIALRGLTVGGTLTLVDGERMVPYPLSDDGQRNFVDVSQIPFNVVQRIDVLKDGASAVYGSDAIAGVVNVILKKTYTGLEVSADAGTSQHSDGTLEHFSVIGGIGDLASNGYNAYLAVEFRNEDPILLANRSGTWANLNWTSYGGADLRPGAYNPSETPYPALLGGYVLNPTTNTLDGTTHFLNTNGCASYAAYVANQCVYNSTAQIQPATQNINVLGRLTKNLGGDWQAMVTASYFRSDSDQQVGGYPFLNGLNPTSLTDYAPGVAQPYVVTTNPVLLPSGPNNPFEGQAALVGTFNQLGVANTTFDTDTYRLFVQLQGSFIGWELSGSAGYMNSQLTQTAYGSINPGMLATAAANGFNFATATGAQMTAAFAPPAEAVDKNTMEVIDVHAARDLFQLPGGPLSFAVGAGYYDFKKDSPAPQAVTNALQFGNGAFVFGSTTNTNLYAELDAPLFKGFEFDAAGRYDHYPQYGSSTTPKFGLKYTPFKMLTLRGTYSEGFRAPNPAEAGNARALFGGLPFNDATLCPHPDNPNAAGNFPSQCNLGVVGLQVSTPTLKPETSKNWTAGLVVRPLNNLDVAVDYYDIKVNQDIQSGTSIFVLSGFNLGMFPVTRGAPVQLPFCTSDNNCTTAEQTPVGPVAYQPFPYFNATETEVKGVDLDLAAHFDLGPFGRVSTKIDANYQMHYFFSYSGVTYDLAGSHGPEIISGDTGNPKARGTASVSWDKGGFDVTASVNYVGRFNLTDPTAGIPDCATAIAFGGLSPPRFPNGAPQSVLNSYCYVKAFTDVDLYSAYSITERLQVHLSILNVFNAAPPVDFQTYGASGDAAYNPAMHQAGAVGRFFSVGAAYKF
jgi:iron complex outermembrane receptor protein